MKTQDGRLLVVGGAARSGKSAWTLRAVAKDRRVWIWDPEDQYTDALPGTVRATKAADLLATVKRAGPLRVAFVPGGDLKPAFDLWAGCILHAARYVAPLTAIAEELADVTTPAKAPGNWGIAIRRGLKRGLTIIAISQRWQEADKTAIGNASEFVFFRQNGAAATGYLERMTGIPAGIIPTAPLSFVRFDPTTGKTTPGRLTF